MSRKKRRIGKLCYECFDDYMYATEGFTGAEKAAEYGAELIERGEVVKCPRCRREIDYERER